MHSLRPADPGHTLPELLAALALLGILLSLAVPSFAELRTEWSLRAATRLVLTGLAEARLAALTTGEGMRLCPSADGQRCADGPASGLLVQSNAAGESPLRSLMLPRRVALSANRPAVAYHPWPRTASPVTVTLCIVPARLRSRQLVVSETGRVRVIKAGAC
ncbi:MAG: GspH/FimT family protein [Steroidobacteraceae bacterium]